MKKISDIEFFKKRSVRIWSAVIAIIVFLSGTALLVWLLSSQMVTDNPRFVLNRVLVRSHDGGFWHGRKNLVCDILRIREGESNLFRLDPGEMRKRLLEREPSIQSVRVIRELPDTLNVEITERIPVARLNENSNLVIDAHTILMEKSRCMNLTASLPVILADAGTMKYPPGAAVSKFRPIVKLINLTRTSFPDLKVGTILIVQKQYLKCTIHYKNEREYYIVTLPPDDLMRHLNILVATLEQLRREKSPKRNIDLRFNKQVKITGVVRPVQDPRS
ncbi:MAG: FtsQ-type POTRA domain-containing protein [Lentisphaeria bacterium]|nr:FtsQ-type POTRA domain-containing protein [Lentisphaeria bacterium]